MLETLLVITVGLLPSLFSLWVIRRARLKANSRIQQAAFSMSSRRLQRYSRALGRDDGRFALRGESYSHSDYEMPTTGHDQTPSLADRYYLEGVGYLIGDISCKFNARSGYMRCAVNPSGPCQDCRHYEPRELGSSEKTL